MHVARSVVQDTFGDVLLPLLAMLLEFYPDLSILYAETPPPDYAVAPPCNACLVEATSLPESNNQPDPRDTPYVFVGRLWPHNRLSCSLCPSADP